MHMLIRIIVVGENKEEALSEADSVVQKLCQEGVGPFDYYDMKANWEDCGKVFDVNRDKGKQLIDEAMRYNKNDFMDKLERIKKIIAANSDENLYNDNPYLFRHYCWHLGEYVGTSTYLYDRYGSGIRFPAELEQSLKDKEDKEQIWIVPVDVHF